MDIKGHTVRTLWIEKASDIAEEYYASFTLDRAAKLHLGMLSAKGGMDIEAVAAEDPDAIARLHVDPVDGLTEDRCREWVRSAKLDEAAHEGVVDVLLELYRAYTDGDADLVEINPLVVLQDGRVLALDAKVSLDSNAAFRHPEWEDYEATQELDAREREAREKGLQYIGLDGSVGVICNGAGMTMATLDVVTEVGGSAANFLDVGGGAGADVLANAIEVVNNDPGVRSILINIFGGITKCDEVALGIVDALERVDLRSPIVVRLDGTNAAEGRVILDERASEQLIPQPTMLDAARKAVELAGAAA
jgi:succinyl-CoA synthetase beta subunit